MLVIIKSDKLQIHKFKSLHNAEQFKCEFIEDFIISKQGNSSAHLKPYRKPKRRHEWLSLPQGYVLTFSRDSSKITCYRNLSSAGTFYNDYTVEKVFSIFIVRVQKKIKRPEMGIVNSQFFDNYDRMLCQLREKLTQISQKFSENENQHL